MTKKKSTKDVDGTYTATSEGPSRKDAWKDAFEQAPEIDSRKSGDVAADRRQGNEDDSTDDSDHEGATIYGAASGERRHTEKGGRDADSQKTNKAREFKRSKSAPSADDGAHKERRSQAAADAAFEEGLGAGKARDKHDKKRRSSSHGSSAHPKGTAVPPRPQEASTGSSKSESRGRATTKEPPPTSSGSSSAPPPSNDSPSSPTKASSQEAKADEGAATAVNEHVLKLDVELDSTRAKDMEWRKTNFKKLLLKWHPDKNTGGMGEAESAAQANEVFKHLLARRDRYLAE
jgi:hypothetical protein